jgi:hypothetical protein
LKGNFEANVAAHFKPLFDDAATIIPADEQSTTTVYIKATAGMRALSVQEQQRVYQTICSTFHTGINGQFQLDCSNIRTLSGEEEALYALISSNYLSKRMTSNLATSLPPVGTIDIGGESMELAYKPQSTTGTGVGSSAGHSSAGALDDVFAKSFDGLGDEAFFATMNLALVTKTSTNVVNPCLFKGYKGEVPVAGLENKAQRTSVVVSGSGNAVECRALIAETLQQLGAAFPQHSGTGEFWAISMAYFVTAAMRELTPLGPARDAFLAKWPEPSVADLTAAADAMCAADWQHIQGQAVDHKANPVAVLPRRCFQASYLSTLLGPHGIGFDSSKAVKFVSDVARTSVNWGLGSLLHDLHPGTLPQLGSSSSSGDASKTSSLRSASSSTASFTLVCHVQPAGFGSFAVLLIVILALVFHAWAHVHYTNAPPFSHKFDPLSMCSSKQEFCRR